MNKLTIEAAKVLKKILYINIASITPRGEPDVVGFDKKTGEYVFYDCSRETLKDGRNVCYDNQALESRKKFEPKDSAVAMADAMGIELLTEEQ